MADLTEAQIREILAGTAGVTPGPWAYEPHGDTGNYGVGVLVGTEGEQPLRGYQTDSDNIVAETVAVEVNGPLNAAHVARLDPTTVAALCNMALRSSGAEAKIAEQAEEIERLRKEVGRKDGALLAFASDANWRQGAAFDPNSTAFCGIGIAHAALAEIGSGK